MKFRDYKRDKEKWITFAESEFYPNYVNSAKERYFPILDQFYELLRTAENSQELFQFIMKQSGKRRIQLLRIFRRYVSPDLSVEMLKVKSRAERILEEFKNPLVNQG